MKYLITGSAGFIGFHITKSLLDKNEIIVGIDNLNDYYDVRLKYARLKELGIEQVDIQYNKIIHSSKYPNFQFIRIDIIDQVSLNDIFERHSFNVVCHFAAQAGVRYSTINPKAFIQSNIIGFINIMECCIQFNIPTFIYASSSNVYGDNIKLPFSENDLILNPKNLYAKTKITNENLAEIYSSHFQISTIGLRLFSVYGTWGRPDMAMMIFTNALLAGLPITVYGNGNMERDFTYVQDVVICIEKIIAYSLTKQCFNEIYNIGSSSPIKLTYLISKLEQYFNLSAKLLFSPMLPEEIQTTHADISKLVETIGYKPKTSFDDGIIEFVKWYISQMWL